MYNLVDLVLAGYTGVALGIWISYATYKLHKDSNK